MSNPFAFLGNQDVSMRSSGSLKSGSSKRSSRMSSSSSSRSINNYEQPSQGAASMHPWNGFTVVQRQRVPPIMPHPLVHLKMDGFLYGNGSNRNKFMRVKHATLPREAMGRSRRQQQPQRRQGGLKYLHPNYTRGKNPKLVIIMNGDSHESEFDESNMSTNRLVLELGKRISEVTGKGVHENLKRTMRKENAGHKAHMD
eukprot:5855627-Pleurochrysis_carterae.AAC.1